MGVTKQQHMVEELKMSHEQQKGKGQNPNQNFQDKNLNQRQQGHTPAPTGQAGDRQHSGFVKTDQQKNNPTNKSDHRDKSGR
jgi:hypothetical protein